MEIRQAERDCAPSAARRLRDLFVGRERELASVQRRIDALRSQVGGLVLVAGEPGIGKTCFLEQVSASSRMAEALVVWGRSWEGEGAPAYWPWLQIFRALAGFEDGDLLGPAEGGAPEIARSVPELQWFLTDASSASAPSVEPADARFRFFDSVATYLKRVAARRPIVLVLDDLHNADHASLLLLQFLSSAVADSAVLIAASYRDVGARLGQPLTEVLGVVNRDPSTDRIHLSGLEHDDVSRFLENAVGSAPADALVQALKDRTAGNPFFLCEIVHLLTRRVDFAASQGGEVWTTAPLSVREAIAKTLQPLSVNCAGVLNVASVVGREFDADLTADAMGIPGSRLRAHLDEALAARVVEQKRATKFVFRHSLVRETIYESLAGASRAELHLNVAEALERQPTQGRNLSALAYHFFMALPHSEPGRVLEYALLAADQAREQLAYEEAAGHYERALDLRDANVPEGFRCDLLLRLGDAQARAGAWLESRNTYAKAAAEARASRDSEQFCKAAIGFKGMMGATTPVDTEAVGLLRDAAGYLEPVGGGLLVEVLSALSRCLYFGDIDDEAIGYAHRAVGIAQSIGDESLQLVALEAQVMSLWRPRTFPRAHRVASDLLRRAVRLGNRDVAFNARLYRNYCLLSRGDLSASDKEMALAQRLADESHNIRYAWQIPMIRAGKALARGDFGESERLSDVARRRGELVHDSSPVHNYMVQLFQRARLRGDFTGLDGALAGAQGRFPELAGYRAAAALLLSRTGRLSEARSILHSFQASDFVDVPMDILSLWILTILAEVAVVCGDSQVALLLYKRLRPFGRQNIVMGWGSAFDGPVAHYLGMLAAQLQRWGVASEHFEVALKATHAAKCWPLLARTRLKYATALFGSGDSVKQARALDFLGEARQAFEQYGMSGFTEECRALETQAVNCDVVAGVPDSAAVVPKAEQDLTARGDQSIFVREGDYWTLGFGDQMVRVKHSRGLALVRVLLERPNVEVHVLDLIAAIGDVDLREPGGLGPRCGGDIGPVLDVRARDQYRSRLRELQDDLAEAEELNDVGRINAIRRENEQLMTQLARAYGKGGRARTLGSTNERARISVRNNISAVLKTLERFHKPLHRHLRGSLKTGAFCSYQPERPVRWTLHASSAESDPALGHRARDS